MPIWIRVDANFDSHPKAIAAGKWGRRAIQVLWRATKLHGRRGAIPAAFVTGAWLAGFTRDGDEDVAAYEDGIRAAIAAGFIEPQPDGTYLMHDWPDYQIDQTAAKRQREHRENTSGGSSDVTDVTRDHRDVTLSRLQDRTLQDRTGQKKDPASTAGRPTWITPYLDRYGSALNGRRASQGQPPLEGELLHEAKDIKALCQYLKKLKDRPTVEAFGFRVDQWLADAWQTDNGLTRLRDFPAWHQRQVRKSKPVGKSDADRAMEEA